MNIVKVFKCFKMCRRNIRALLKSLDNRPRRLMKTTEDSRKLPNTYLDQLFSYTEHLFPRSGNYFCGILRPKNVNWICRFSLYEFTIGTWDLCV